MRAELRRLEKPSEISRQASLAFCDKGIVEPGRRDEGCGKDALRRERAWVVEGIVEGYKLLRCVSDGIRRII